MSVSIVLVPLAFAAIGAWQASRKGADANGVAVCQVQTRMKDERLLVAALAETGAVTAINGQTISARWAGVDAEFARDTDGIWRVDFTGDITEEAARDIVLNIDAAYGRQVQQAVLQRIRDRAQASGMSIASESIEADETVVLTLDMGQVPA